MKKSRSVPSFFVFLDSSERKTKEGGEGEEKKEDKKEEKEEEEEKEKKKEKKEEKRKGEKENKKRKKVKKFRRYSFCGGKEMFLKVWENELKITSPETHICRRPVRTISISQSLSLFLLTSPLPAGNTGNPIQNDKEISKKTIFFQFCNF